jgi:hypothetical protein
MTDDEAFLRAIAAAPDDAARVLKRKHGIEWDGRYVWD